MQNIETVYRQVISTLASNKRQLLPQKESIQKGRVSIDMLRHLGFPEASDQTFYMLCGPPDFNKACKEMLTAAGHSEDRVFG